MEKKKPVKREFSAGGAVYKKSKIKDQKSKILWLVIRPKERNRWQLPKGWIDERENAKTAAIREVAEEGGVRGEIVDKIDTVNFFFRYSYEGAPKELVNKTVTFFLMEYQEDIKEGPGWETKEIAWLPYEEAYQKLTFDSEKKILEKAKKILEEKER